MWQNAFIQHHFLYPIDFELSVGGKQIHPDERTTVSDSVSGRS
ncbi:hypothetical protein yfred0001_21270 [Yersinia frederiksenii ATCC 33641]|nr:hypothetical protein yfred0001_21270 [Yersinia frederiksenii ATCC 33641]